MLLNTLFKAQFNYCPLVWMLHIRKLNKINRLRERCLRIIYNNNLTTFFEILELDNSVSIHHRNLHCFAIELYNTFKNNSPDIMKDIFPLNTSSIYDIKNRQTLQNQNI